ncbi:zinc finger SWIM domain-containing protein 7 isoform X2 [Podarcis raffonei]|uniref:zinc finger SWIM domain-containing protein 7 isoform X2 n=1 Tax=Podarcis raffonei TaxID=65483 RepID=UPI0023293598|nr:zinc finger SWIM domain-containing protein 7 isoform X2 [Podarcis raffonei]
MLNNVISLGGSARHFKYSFKAFVPCTSAKKDPGDLQAISSNNPYLLKFIFGASAVPALDLVDRQSVTRITSPSGRQVYQVVGSSGKHYTCYASCHFCSCPAFMFSVLRKGDSLVCKHLLAIYLSQALGSCQELTVPDKQLTRLLLQEEEEEER